MIGSSLLHSLPIPRIQTAEHKTSMGGVPSTQNGLYKSLFPDVSKAAFTLKNSQTIPCNFCKASSHFIRFPSFRTVEYLRVPSGLVQHSLNALADITLALLNWACTAIAVAANHLTEQFRNSSPVISQTVFSLLLSFYACTYLCFVSNLRCNLETMVHPWAKCQEW